MARNKHQPVLYPVDANHSPWISTPSQPNASSSAMPLALSSWGKGQVRQETECFVHAHGEAAPRANATRFDLAADTRDIRNP